MNDDFLTRFRRSPRPEFAATLYKRINHPMSTTNSTFPPAVRRVALALGVLLVLLTTTLVVSPAARAFSQTVLRQVGLITFTAETMPEPDERPLPTPNATSTPIAFPRPQYASELEQVTSEAGFQPMLPAYLPEGYQQDKLVAMEYLSDASEHVAWGTSARYVTADGLQYLDVQQARFNTAQEFPIGDTPIVDVTVRGHEGVWLEQALEAPEAIAEPPYNQVSILLWDEDGYTISIFTNSLPLEELLKVADSLH